MSGDYPKMEGRPPATTPGAASDIATARVGQKRDAEKGWSLNIIITYVPCMGPAMQYVPENLGPSET